MKGNENIRNDLNRLIWPRLEPKSNPIYILWTNTRDDITTEHWVPNHFVPLLPFDYKHVDTATEHHMNNNRTDNNQNNHHVETAADDIQVNNDQVNEIISDNGSSNVEQNNANELHVDNNVCKMDKNEKRYFVPDIKECLNRYVIVNFNSKPYPGLVQEVHNEEVEVLCMHQVGRKKSLNCFFWPKKKNLSWYDFNKIMTVIPEPTPIENSKHVLIDDKLFDHARCVCKSSVCS
ncbi:hypothetical protein MAR_034006 [Mya arenaria]|uniref:Uncharacterized protein n=1 Tax=Mya arenaria TaxID=6604 RepID=A0ABY7GDP7_MYAAR|nr:hypothetical protein MAR_034006 [Mya arenaria]